jgi:AcrR family transcriptional regulator
VAARADGAQAVVWNDRETAAGEVAEIQRSRLLSAAVGALEDVGFERVTVEQITHRARVSRRTFYELFANREQCLAAALEDAGARVERELAQAGLAGLSWRERMREGLWRILCLLEREPALARMIVIHAAQGNGPVLLARERLLARLVAEVDRGRVEGRCGQQCSALTAEGVLGAVVAILRARLVQGARGAERLTALFAELLGAVLLPYEGGAVARREQARSVPRRPVPAVNDDGRAWSGAGDALSGLPMRVTYRTAKVLQIVGERPAANNRQVAERAGVSDAGQVSKLLARLERLGLIANSGGGHTKGEPNAWTLTATGEMVARDLAVHLRSPGAGGRR